jgi:polar amino acid transport system substrate-binding protein
MEDEMRANGWVVAILGVMLTSCASVLGTNEQMGQSLAPSGQLRVAFLSGPLYATKDVGTGEFKGVAVDLGRSLASQVGVPMQPVVYPGPAAIIAGAKAGEWDVAFMGVSADRAAAVDFSAPYMEVEQGFLVRVGVSITSASGVDQPGVRIGVLEKAGADVLLSRTLKNATLVRVKSTGDLDALLVSGNADVIAATKAFLYGRLASRPGARLLDGRIMVEPIAMAVPKGRDPAAASAIAQFVEEAKRSGQVKVAIERAGLRGVVVAPSN